MTSLTSIDELENLLLSHDINLSLWGEGHYKSLENLWQEIEDGDATLQLEPLQRIIRFVQIIIRQNGHLLIEREQMMANGSFRQRNRPLSEKIQSGESITTSAVRGIAQELGVEVSREAIRKVVEDPLTAVRDSQSYPGLTTFYTVFTVEAAVPGLPTTDFQTEENSPTDPVRAHYWKWLPEAEARRLF